ncbi:MAG TPA: metalloregulator ArsR/SmtB family transcription factor [Candidatus Limnocylindrales bacterium]
MDEQRLEGYRLRAEVCKVLTDPKRLMLIDALRRGELTVGELAEAIGASLPNASQHLAVLRTAGLVEGSRAATQVRYRLVEPAIAEACDVVGRIVARRLDGAPSGRGTATHGSGARITRVDRASGPLTSSARR